MAFVYEWRAQNDDVQIALCNSEFMEKSGNSLKGGVFVPAETLAVDEVEQMEDWSTAILQNLLSSDRADPAVA
jgi:hypothetical protein